MTRSDPRRWLALGFTSVLIAACGSSASPTPAPTTAPTTAPTASGPVATPSPTPLPGTKTFKVASPSPGVDHAPWMAALDDLRAQGYTITNVVLDQPELVTEGVANGTFAFGSGANNAEMTAVDKGAPLRLVINRVNDDWMLYAANSITGCAGLNGKKLAINSQGSVSTYIVKAWIQSKCPGTTPNWVVIAGSPNRVTALLANQIDASPLELSDAVTLDAKASDRYHLLANYAQDLPDLQTTSVFMNADWAKANPGTVLAVVEATLQEFRKVNASTDGSYLKQISQKEVPDVIDASTIDAVAKKYLSAKMFPNNGGLTQANLQYTATFFGPAPAGTGSTSKVLSVDQFADLSFLQTALNALGTQ